MLRAQVGQRVPQDRRNPSYKGNEMHLVLWHAQDNGLLYRTFKTRKTHAFLSANKRAHRMHIAVQ